MFWIGSSGFQYTENSMKIFYRVFLCDVNFIINFENILYKKNKSKYFVQIQTFSYLSFRSEKKVLCNNIINLRKLPLLWQGEFHGSGTNHKLLFFVEKKLNNGSSKIKRSMCP